MTYLPFNPNWKKWGRIVDLKLEGPSIEMKFQSGEVIRSLYKEDYEFIKVNDWVALNDKDQWVVVTPSKSLPKKGPSKETLEKWALFLQLTRSFFQSQKFLELHTPSLVTCPGTEPSLDVFPLELKNGAQTFKKFLPTSPEIHLKKALILGHERIFEICKCYRNGEITEIHQPEFWMIEWYRSFSNLTQIQVDCVRLVHSLCDQLKCARPKNIETVSLHQLFKKHLNFDLKPDTTILDYRNLALLNGIHVKDNYSIDDLFFLLMLEKIEPHLNPDHLIFVENYPPFQAALARKNHEGWALRFEMYWKGMELANAFDELNDPAEQRLRAGEDLQKRENRTPIQLDEEFFQALESGMPPSGGIALGLERLFMALYNIRNIQDIRLFPVG